MSILDELKQLQELPTPTMPTLWPQTWGWLVFIALIAVLIGALLLLWQRRRQANAYRREALAELDLIMQCWQQQPGNYAPLRDIPALLKRAAISRLGGDAVDVARMRGREWQGLLERMTPSPIPNNLSQSLALLAYAQEHEFSQIDLTTVVANCRLWLETHDDPV